jgi:hypothetical protein
MMIICFVGFNEQELLKFTPADHPDHTLLQQALKKVENVTSFLNTRKKEQIFQHQLVEAMSKVFGSPVVSTLSSLSYVQLFFHFVQ